VSPEETIDKKLQKELRQISESTGHGYAIEGVLYKEQDTLNGKMVGLLVPNNHPNLNLQEIYNINDEINDNKNNQTTTTFKLKGIVYFITNDHIRSIYNNQEEWVEYDEHNKLNNKIGKFNKARIIMIDRINILKDINTNNLVESLLIYEVVNDPIVQKELNKPIVESSDDEPIVISNGSKEPQNKRYKQDNEEQPDSWFSRLRKKIGFGKRKNSGYILNRNEIIKIHM
jgi:hypothetical protein